jgi:prepilin-type N-terminal cleavage/methylation domain-containing protein
MTRRPLRRRGWTLIEMVVVIMCLSVLLSLLGSLLWAVFRIQNAATASFEQLQTESNLADRFRDDVAAARDSPDLAADFQASPLCMILRGESDGFIIYRFLDDRVDRVDMRTETSQIESYKVTGDDAVAEFGRRGRLMTLTLRGPQGGALTIAAALGGGQP